MNKYISLTLVALLFMSSCMRRGEGSVDVSTQEDTVPQIGFFPSDFTVDSTKVREGETFTGLTGRLGLGNLASLELVQNCDSIFDAKRMRAGNPVEAYYSADSSGRKLEYIVYHNDKIRATVFSCADSLRGWLYDKPVLTEHKIADVTITSSLWNDMLAKGISPLLIVDLADIYAWTVNFFGLQGGDRFRVIYDQTVCDGEVVRIDSVEFALYDSGSFRAAAIRFDQRDGGNKYWNEKGESMRKAFLKAPLRYNRISSRFTYHRKHPITGVVRPHTAVDYAAPTGTPVHSIGDGTVTMCGWDGTGGGNRIRIRHMNGYETCYMHLSKFASGIKSGVRVSQGQTIGYVGSTGHSTGPHLDFRVWKDGTPVDPLKMISPPSEPLNKDNLDSLHKMYNSFLLAVGE
ncbi:MAG: M23 family metallopeptidase [Bacteroidales bacterium]|nr:M23 family metallopeptidase [Bacteroidales bacterium]